MSVETLERQPARDTWAAEDEIDLRQYIDIIIRWWREILLITFAVALFAALAILALRLLLPPGYEASADVAIVRTLSDVTFDPRFRTTSDEQVAEPGSANARRTALLGLVATGAIAQEVIAQVGNQLTAKELVPANLLEMVKAEAATTTGVANAASDLIRITVTADTPEKAAAIANAWGRAYVDEVNTIYGQVPDEMLNSIQTELATAQQTYTTNQANLEAFIAGNQIDELNSQVTMLQQRINQETSLQQGYLKQWQDAQQQLAAAQALRLQVEQGGEGAVRSNMVALQVLKLSAYGLPPGNLQIEMRDLPDINQTAMITDVNGLIVSLTKQVQDLTAQIVAHGEQLPAPATDQVATDGAKTTLAQTFDQLRSLKAQLETESARQLQLIQQRDLSWETFKTLSSKVAELNLARAAASSEVRFGAPAVAPIDPVNKVSLVLGTAAAGVVGGVLALFYAFLAEYLGRPPFLVRKQTAVASLPSA